MKKLLIISAIFSISLATFATLKLPVDILLKPGIFVIVLYQTFLLTIYFYKKIVEPLIQMKKHSVVKYDYYREELKEYSPMISAKIIGRNVFSNDVIVSMILYLEEKKTVLCPHEQFFVDHKNQIFKDLKEGTDSDYEDTVLEWKLIDLIEEDLKSFGLVNDEYKENTGYIGFVDAIPFLLLFLNISIIWAFLDSNLIFKYLSNFIMKLEIYSNLLWLSISVISVIFNIKTKKYFTDRGLDYYYKIQAYKKFLKHFSIIGDRTIKEKVLLYSHIRNAILLNLKGQLDVDSNNYYKEIIKQANYDEKVEIKKLDIIDITIRLILLISSTLFILWFIITTKFDKESKKLFMNFILMFVQIGLIKIRNPKIDEENRKNS